MSSVQTVTYVSGTTLLVRHHSSEFARWDRPNLMGFYGLIPQSFRDIYGNADGREKYPKPYKLGDKLSYVHNGFLLMLSSYQPNSFCEWSWFWLDGRLAFSKWDENFVISTAYHHHTKIIPNFVMSSDVQWCCALSMFLNSFYKYLKRFDFCG